MPDKQVKTELVEQDEQKYRVTLYYWIERKRNPGFYLTAAPVEHKNGFETFVVTNLRSVYLLPCNRFSKKAEAQALQLAAEKQAELINSCPKSSTQSAPN